MPVSNRPLSGFRLEWAKLTANTFAMPLRVSPSDRYNDATDAALWRCGIHKSQACEFATLGVREGTAQAPT
jgi:hypothetical protein